MNTYPIIKLSENVLQSYVLEDSKGTLSGYEERKFFDLLGHKIKLKRKIKVRLNNYSFIPDALFLKDNFALDIEIDEPYSHVEPKPIHYIGSDDYRDEKLKANGVSVIRFAEYQVIKFPETCIQIIINIIKGKDYLYNINIDGKFRVKRWTENDSLQFIKEEKRKYYDFKTEKINESEFSFVASFAGFDGIVEFIKTNYIDSFNPAVDVIVIPYMISDMKSHISTMDKMIYCEGINTNIELEGMKSPAFRNHPRLEITKSNNEELFNTIYSLKNSSKKIKLISPKKCLDHEHNDLYNIAFWGNHIDFNNNTYKYKTII